jgi:hypothetical protein
MVEVVRGLTPGDTILLGSSQELPEGTIVRIQKENEVSGPVQSGNARRPEQAKQGTSER